MCADLHGRESGSGNNSGRLGDHGEDCGKRSPDLDRDAVLAELERARREYRELLARADPADLRRRSAGTRWTNHELLFHMLLGFLVVRALLVLATVFGMLPDPASKVFARLLDAARRPFHRVNYLGSCAGARIIPRTRLVPMLDGTVAALAASLTRKSQRALRCGMHYPTTWDPFFAEYMTQAELYRYPAKHFWFHRAQLTLAAPE